MSLALPMLDRPSPRPMPLLHAGRSMRASWWLHPVAAMLALLLGRRSNDLATTRCFPTARGLSLIYAAATRPPTFQPRGVPQ